MKRTLEEIEKMLSEISPWPWHFKYSDINGVLVSLESKNDFGTLSKITICDFSSYSYNDHKRDNIRFIKNSPEVISDLVEEVKRLKPYSIVAFQSQEMAKETAEENKRLREVLNQIAYEHPLCTVSGQPVNLFTHLRWVLDKARKALEGNK